MASISSTSDDTFSSQLRQTQIWLDVSFPSLLSGASPIEEKRQVLEEAAVLTNEGEEWRKEGKLYRAKLVLEDEATGGDTFVMNEDCSIELYFELGERAFHEFRKRSLKKKIDLTASYIVGKRLLTFLFDVLPIHKDYYLNQPHLADFRRKSQDNMVHLLQYLEEVALEMDRKVFKQHPPGNKEDNHNGLNPSLESYIEPLADLLMLCGDTSPGGLSSLTPTTQSPSSDSTLKSTPSPSESGVESETTSSTVDSISQRTCPRPEIDPSIDQDFLTYKKSHIDLLQQDGITSSDDTITPYARRLGRKSRIVGKMSPKALWQHDQGIPDEMKSSRDLKLNQPSQLKSPPQSDGDNSDDEVEKRQPSPTSVLELKAWSPRDNTVDPSVDIAVSSATDDYQLDTKVTPHLPTTPLVQNGEKSSSMNGKSNRQLRRLRRLKAFAKCIPK